MKSRIAFLFLIIVFGISPLLAQKNIAPNLKKLNKEQLKKLDAAEGFYDEKDFLRALPLYVDLMEAHPGEFYYKFRSGVCYIYKSDEKENSISLLKRVEEAHPTTPDLYFYLGRAHHVNNKFDEAIDYFNKYLAQNPPINQQRLSKRYIENSKNGKAFLEVKLKCEIYNIGSVINTENQEYVPVISSDQAVLIYTYTGPRSTGGLMDSDFNPDPNGYYYEDVLISQRLGDRWLNSESIGPNINTKNHDASIGLSADGQQLFLFHSTEKDGGDIYASHLDGEIWGIPERLGPTINTKYWEGSCSISADEQTLFFASERPGGQGGRDIYVSKKMPDGTWGIAENIGSAVNTSLDDDSPFIHPDGKTLYFSSEGHNSIGGYDIMYSTYSDGTWSKPTSMGYPINTTEDERFYVLTADGENGYFSSNRKGGYGQQDIYAVNPGFINESPILSLVIGVVSANEKPASATINVTNAETGEKKGSFRSNSATGKYLLALTPGNNYKVAIEIQGYESQIQYVNVKSLDTYVQVQKNFQFYTDEYKKENGITVADSSNALQSDIDKQVKQNNAEKDRDVYEARVYQDLIKKHGDVVKDSVSFNVELGTFANASDFDAERYKGLGEIKSRVDEKGNTVYSMGPFKNLLDAEIFKYKVYGKESSGWKNPNIVVTVNDKGERKLIQEYYNNDYKRKDYVPPTDTYVIKNKAENQQFSTLEVDRGKLEVEGISYKVEIAAVDNPDDFNLQKLSKYGKIESKKYPDGKTRYTLGPFKTLAEAEAFKKTLVEKEPEAAKSFVTVVYFGARKTLEEFKEIQKTEQPKEPVVVKETPKPQPEKPKEPVVVKQTPKPQPIVSQNICDPNAPQDFSYFVGKDLNDKEVYNKLVNSAGNICIEGLIFRVQIGAYRKPENFKHKNLNSLEPPPALVLPYPDGITRFTMREYKTLREAEAFRQEVIRLGTTDAWVTAVYQGNRMLLQELIANNFFNRKVN
ncbi:MAG: hypothetical protein ACT4ON_03120 [Bacteroidota bacterium]